MSRGHLSLEDLKSSLTVYASVELFAELSSISFLICVSSSSTCLLLRRYCSDFRAWPVLSQHSESLLDSKRALGDSGNKSSRHSEPRRAGKMGNARAKCQTCLEPRICFKPITWATLKIHKIEVIDLKF
jgi:hypothetical protein